MIMDGHTIVLEKFRSAGDLRPKILVESVIKQLQAQKRRSSGPYRYSVTVEIIEGGTRPANDLDNYAKPIIDAVTQSRLLWKDDKQIDELIIRRRRDGRLLDSAVTLTISRITGQHSGVPSHFREQCLKARRGTITYSQLGYYLSSALQSEGPHDLDEECWQNEVSRLTDLLSAGQEDDAWIWFLDHLPRFMEFVPNRHKQGFLSGVVEAHENGEIDQ